MPHVTIRARSVPIVVFTLLTACHDAASTAPSVAVAPVPGHVQVVSGMAQRAPAGTALALPVRVQVTDPRGAPIAGQPVTFAVTAGGGALAGTATVLADASGMALSPAWVLGRYNVPQVITATAGAISLDVPATVATNLVIDIHYVGTVDAAVKTAIESAVSRLTAIITDGYTPVAISGFDVEAGCGVPGAGTLTGTVSGLALYVSERTIDFDKGILAYANLCAVRDDGHHLPVVSAFSVDVNDVTWMQSAGALQDTALHEMLHALGFGFWMLADPSAPLTGIDNALSVPVFLGARARQACNQIAGVVIARCSPAVWLAFGQGQGSDDAHWNEATFQSELMTPYTSGFPNPLSAMTVEAMGDLGYTVNPSAADPFSLTSAVVANLQASGTIAAPSGTRIRERLVRPRWAVTRTGAVRRLPN